VLQLFGKSQYAARKKYRDFVEKGIGGGRNPEITGGGLLRSIGGWGVLKSMRRMKIHIKGDEPKKIFHDGQDYQMFVELFEESSESGTSYNPSVKHKVCVFNKPINSIR
jgi:hypothetical protein